MISAMRKLTLLAATVAVAAATVAAPAHASKTQESVFQDDRALVFSGDGSRDGALTEMQSLGADTIHSLAFWSKIAPAAASRRKPSGFDGSDPTAYAPEAWDGYDGLVRGAQARGLGLILTPSGRVPSWAAGCGRRLVERQTCRPDPVEYGKFVAALGKRYSGSYHDENQGGGVLPRVTRWSIWNEPNQAGWITPQLTRKNGRTVPAAPQIYRSLVYAGVKALRASGHGGEQIALGETAPIPGRQSGPPAKRSLAPLPFYQSLFCLDSVGRSLSGSAGRDQGCSGRYQKLGVNAITHHPYNKGGSRPPLSRASAGEITIASASRLEKVLAQGAAHRRLPGNLPIFYTEFGFQTNPPDHTFGVSVTRQAEYINQSDYIAFRDSRIRSVSQYELFDEPDLASFQTGLRFKDGRAKPSFDAYRLPIYVIRRGSSVRVFGLVRPAADGSSPQVQIQNGSGSSFQTVKTVAVANAKGYFLTGASGGGSRWRLAWTSGGQTLFSRVATAARR